MKRDDSSADFERDPVWELLRESAAQRPGPNFASNVVRAARLETQAKPWWSRFLIPASLGGVLAGATALVMVTLALKTNPGGTATPIPGQPAVDSSLADLQDDYETEVFLAAAEHLGDYSDEELVSMIGF
ncbi:hypothetical protein [Luteolibacter luteus]|uniref:Uncharacterized protein n=1 Tax=Luteolibacter luteus TaxID=2728835 RepID=A0A858REN8_9BACT|nr:hypothetical protein [Luteolibacter luteus]QJE94869.1 hypothetical protein HHL09_03440 [Luteolibacter luteus]